MLPSSQELWIQIQLWGFQLLQGSRFSGGIFLQQEPSGSSYHGDNGARSSHCKGSACLQSLVLLLLLSPQRLCLHLGLLSLVLLNELDKYSDIYNSPDGSCSDFSITDTDDPTDSDAQSEPEAPAPKPCEYYNNGNCRFGKKCRDLHVCKYFLKGSCRYGAACRLKHTQSGSNQGGANHSGNSRRRRGHRRRSSSSSSESDEDSGRPYRWQLDLGNGWEDVANDYILEAQYSRPNTRGITIYNTPCGAITIDFTKMRIKKKTNLRVRRKGSSQTEWIWYYCGDNGWYYYGQKGKASPIQSSDLESAFQTNPRGSKTFNVDSTTYEIKFKDMSQRNLSTGHRRRVVRRPKYDCAKDGGKVPQWQFGGKNSRWHTFKRTHGCTVSSADIEAAYQQNPNGCMNFTVGGQPYKLDFSNMTQTNLSTNKTRRIQRV
ncbi:protein mono-ADP-ribosyltransferase PARP12 [Chanos chanos]|uniref:Protein mono-ADP-ribosyltransferase PARP12 n=1 Tax=Chanos chanos TaxID=29144 RepID=A0A6J2VCT4_CHACN|nr:protein mono-ADP-ribosyltransferase PARP12-like [Chanos chanos]